MMRFLGSVATIIFGLAVGVAQAQDGVSKLVMTPLPNWQLGDIDKALSKMCSLGQFNQRVPYRFSAHFHGPSGASLVGGAKGNGLNLWDPFRKRDPARDYWFLRDRTSNCIVYSWPVSPGNGAPLPPQRGDK